jgi:hypothetical protein
MSMAICVMVLYSHPLSIGTDDDAFPAAATSCCAEGRLLFPRLWSGKMACWGHGQAVATAVAKMAMKPRRHIVVAITILFVQTLWKDGTS